MYKFIVFDKVRLPFVVDDNSFELARESLGSDALQMFQSTLETCWSEDCQARPTSSSLQIMFVLATAFLEASK